MILTTTKRSKFYGLIIYQAIIASADTTQVSPLMSIVSIDLFFFFRKYPNTSTLQKSVLRLRIWRRRMEFSEKRDMVSNKLNMMHGFSLKYTYSNTYF
jgi:hypothetical protein